MKVEILTPKYSGQKSFCHKAMVTTEGSTKRLLSYGQLVAKYNFNEKRLTLYSKWDCSAPTLKHVKEFILQCDKYYIPVIGTKPLTSRGIKQAIADGLIKVIKNG